jgi:3-deoxy-7-phosphoheptulonate synthase
MKSLKKKLADDMLVLRGVNQPTTVIDVKGCPIGGESVMVVAGPCAIENEDLLKETAFKVRGSGAVALRGGAFKPRTSPYSFQGLGQ